MSVHFRVTAIILMAAAAFSSACRDSAKASGGPCTVSKDCSSGNVCVLGACKPKTSAGCKSDDACGLGDVCDPQSGECVPEGSGPGPGPVDPGPCTEDQSCPAHQRCDLAIGMCVNGRRSCADDGPCTAIGQRCDTAKGLCVDCLTEEHCVDPLKCTDGTCLDPTISMSCNDDSACAPPDSVCMNAICVRGCATPDGFMCTGGNLCNPATGHCENPNGCTTDTQCGAPAGVCENGSCLPGCGQLGGIVCNPGSVCDTGNGRCVEVLGPCNGDSDCTPPSSVCESRQCIPGCGRAGGVQCSGPTQCNPQSGRCEMGGDFCGSDLDCMSPAEICDLNTGACNPGCGTTGCTSPATCNASTGHCSTPMACILDAFEDNDTAATAANIAAGTVVNLFGCPADDDYYRFTLGFNDSLTVNLTYAYGEGNLDIDLIDPNGAVISSGRTMTGMDSVNIAASVAGTYVIRVYLERDLGPNPGNSYTLNMVHVAAPCAIDAYEDNDDENNPAIVGPGAINNVNVCANDEDWYGVDVNSGDTINVDVTFNNSEGDIDLQLINFFGFPVSSSGGTGNSENISFTANLNGIYAVRVFLYSDSGAVAGNPYSITIGVNAMMQNPPMMCTADVYEENDTRATGVPLSGQTTALNVCSADDDYYTINANTGDRIQADVSFSDAEGDIDIQLFDPGGTQRASSGSAGDLESLVYVASSAGVYALRVFLYADAGSITGNTYDVALTTAGCGADQFEPNDSQGGAPLIALGSYPGLGACMMDEDFYSVELNAGDNFVADVTFANVQGDIDMILWDAAGNLVDSSAGLVNSETITWTVTDTGIYTVNVYLYSDPGPPGNTYTMTLSR